MTDRPFRRVLDFATGSDTIIYLTDEEIAEREAAAMAQAVPSAVSSYQARVALLQAGHLSSVEALMAHPDTPAAAKIAWEYATTIRRESPFIAALGPALGLSGEQLDNLFRLAASIE